MKIPDRWLDYKSIGQIVDGSNFIAFKVPLHKHISESLPLDERHTTLDIVKAIPKLGIVINLTNTKNDTKYYSPRDWEKHGIEYKWIKTEGHVTPSQSNLVQFCRTVKNFLIGNPEKLIGVHCTHGLNRTGYFVCSYMVLCNNVSPSDAIRNFSVARGHQIERINYINSLMTHVSNQPLKEVVARRATVSVPSSRNNSETNRRHPSSIPNSRPVAGDNSRHRNRLNLSTTDRRQIHTHSSSNHVSQSRWDNYNTRQQHNSTYRSSREVDSRESYHQNLRTRRIAHAQNVSRHVQPSDQRSSRFSEQNGNSSRSSERRENAPTDPGWSQWVKQKMGSERK